VAHEPDDARGNEAVEQIGSDHVVVGRAYCFPDVVQQGRRPEGAIGGLAPGEIEGLERVEEGVPFGVVARILTDAVEAEEEIEEIVVHARGGAPEGDAHGLDQGARSHPPARPAAKKEANELSSEADRPNCSFALRAPVLSGSAWRSRAARPGASAGC
jgi:hypothetical protein